MTEQSRDRWTTRDYPVLVAAAGYLDANPGRSLSSPDLAELVGRDHLETLAALSALTPTHLIGKEDRRGANMLASIVVIEVTERGRRAAGLWPAHDNHLASLIAALQSAAEQTDDPEQRSTLRRVGDGLAAAPGNIAAGAVTAWLAAQGGL